MLLPDRQLLDLKCDSEKDLPRQYPLTLTCLLLPLPHPYNSCVQLRRSSGILLHPTSLPGRFGIGDLGPEAFQFVDFLHSTKQSLWQVLPLGPTGYGDSPYQTFSAFAGNPLLISLEKLSEEGLLAPCDLDNPPSGSLSKVDFSAVTAWKLPLLRKAYETFCTHASASQREVFQSFCMRNSSLA